MHSTGGSKDLPAIRAHYADILCQLAEEKGVPRNRLLGAAGVRPAVLGHPDNLITLDQFAALNRCALELTGDAALGLEFGGRLKFTTHGALSQAAISSETIADALSILIKYFRIRFSYMALTFFTEGDEAVLQLDILRDLDGLEVFNVEVVMASIMDVNLLLFGTRLLVNGSCRLSYPAPAHGAAYRRLFGDRVSFGTGVNQLRFGRDFLDLPIALSNPVARRVAEAQCEEEMRNLEATSSVATRVQRLLDSVRSGRLPGLEEVAGQLHTSARTLRRQLGAEGVRFQEILDRVRHRRAIELLTRAGLSIDEVAYRLGYSDPSNFGRAFRKWEGCSPSVYRTRQRS